MIKLFFFLNQYWENHAFYHAPFLKITILVVLKKEMFTKTEYFNLIFKQTSLNKIESCLRSLSWWRIPRVPRKVKKCKEKCCGWSIWLTTYNTFIFVYFFIQPTLGWVLQYRSTIYPWLMKQRLIFMKQPK